MKQREESVEQDSHLLALVHGLSVDVAVEGREDVLELALQQFPPFPSKKGIASKLEVLSA